MANLNVDTSVNTLNELLNKVLRRKIKNILSSLQKALSRQFRINLKLPSTAKEIQIFNAEVLHLVTTLTQLTKLVLYRENWPLHCISSIVV